MKNASWTIRFLYSAVFFSALGCSSAPPTVRSIRTQTATPAPVNGNTTENSNTDATKKTTEPTPKAEDKAATPAPTPSVAQPLTLTSAAFANMGAIPVANAAAGQGGMNVSPALQWRNPPAGTGSFVIQMVDLDFLNPAPAPFIHWVITNIPVTSTQLPGAIPVGNNLAAPAEALGASQFKAYRGPNPPNAHRYEWTIYAIKQGETVNIIENSVTNKAELEAKSLGKATLIGIFTP